MEYLNESKVCRKFLNQYNEKLIPKLLPRLVKIAIFSLYKTFHKCLFSMQELDQYIKYFNDKKRNLEFESKNNNARTCPPCSDYLTPNINKIQKLNMSYQPSEGLGTYENEKVANDRYDNGRFYRDDDEKYVNKKNNFYDENYYIPKSHSFRNIQLYQNRLKNPRFTTQEKKIYPEWWWNLKDDIDQDDYSDDNSELDHHNRRGDRFPNDIEKELKKKEKYFERPKSCNGAKSFVNQYYEDSNTFPNTNAMSYDNYKDTRYYKDENICPDRNITSYDNYKNRNTNLNRNSNPFNEKNSKYHNNMAESDGFRSYIPKIMNDNKNSYNIRYYSSNINDPNYSSSPNLRGQPKNLAQSDGFVRNRTQFNRSLGPRDEEPNFDLGYPDYINDENQNQLSSSQCYKINKSLDDQKMNIYNNLYGTSDLKNKNLTLKQYKKSFALSYDKDFNIRESKVKRNGKIKNGLKYSCDGNQLNEYLKGTKKKRKKPKKTHNDQ